MQSDDLEQYMKTAVEHGVATAAGDWRRANAAHDRLLAALQVLRSSPDRGQSALSQALSHVNSSVVCWAATHLLPLDERRSTDVLVQLSAQPGIIGFNAKTVLNEWRAGNLKDI